MKMLTALEIAQTLHADAEDSAAIVKFWPHVDMELAAIDGFTERVQVAAAATIRVECPRFVPQREVGDNLRFMRLYWENEHVRKMLGNVTPEDAVKYCGRGAIQLTGLDNYRRCGLHIGVDLVNHPDLALVPENSAKIFVWFFQHCYKAANLGEWTEVRKIVNGGTNDLDAFLRYTAELAAAAGIPPAQAVSHA